MKANALTEILKSNRTFFFVSVHYFIFSLVPHSCMLMCGYMIEKYFYCANITLKEPKIILQKDIYDYEISNIC